MARRSGRRQSAIPASLGMGAGLFLALGTQLWIGRGASGELALLGYAVATALFVVGLRLAANTSLLHWTPPADADPEPVGVGISPRLAVAAALLGALTFLTSGGNRFHALNTTAWLASIVLGLAACWEPPARWPDRATFRRLAERWSRISLRPTWTLAGLGTVVLCGALLLFYRLADVPSEMQSDHAEKLLDVQDVLNGEHRIFFPRNTGREAFQFYWIALLTPVFGLTYLNMKVGTALLGFVTVPLTFLLGRTLFGVGTGLLAAALLATSRWHLLIARRGLRFPFPALFGAAIFLFLVRALRDRRRADFLLCGLLLGAAQHTYIPLRFAPLAVLACIAIALSVDVWRRAPRARIRRLLLDTGLMLGMAGLVFMPLARYAVDNPRGYLFRGVSRLAGDSVQGAPANAAEVFLVNVKNALLAFNWRGDTAWVNNIPLEPFLDPVTGALFVLGCAYIAYRLVRYRELPFVYLLVMVLVGLLPSIISIAFPVENPATARSSMALPGAMLIAALAARLVILRTRVLVGGTYGAPAAGVVTAMLLFAIVRSNFQAYFHVYPAQYMKITQHTSPVAALINGFFALGGTREDARITLWPHWIDARSVAIQTGAPYWDPVIANAEEALRQDGVPRARLYVVNPSDRASLERLSQWYPGAIVHTHRLEALGGAPYVVSVLVPAGAVARR